MIIKWFLVSLIIIPALGILVGSMIGKRDISFAVACASALPGLMSLPLVLLYGEVAVVAPFGSILGSYYLFLDLFSAVFISLSSLVYLVTVLHMVASSSMDRKILHPSTLSAFYLACTTAFLANDVILLLISWEGVSLFSFLLTDLQGKSKRESWRYLVITHLGGLMIMASLLYLFFLSEVIQISAWYYLDFGIDSLTSSILIILLILGFGTKLGLMPFHVWMSGLYDRAPPHAISLIAAVSANVVIFLLVRLIFSFMDFQQGSVTLSLIVMFLASITAIWASLQALLQDSPMKVLAFSSMKNMALAILMLGLSMLFASHGSMIASGLALMAALLHTLNHSIFKSLNILGIAEAQESMNEDRFQKFGGLAKTAPILSMFMLVGVLSMAALPPFNGFISEWMMIQSMMEAFALGVEPYRIALPLGVAVLGLSGALGAASYLRLYGFVFLGRPRSEGSMNPQPTSKYSVALLGILALSCLLLGLFSLQLIELLSIAISAMLDVEMIISLAPPFTLGRIDPSLMGILLVVIIFLIAALMKLRPSKINRSRTWDCGTDQATYMQYSARAFSQPLAKVFESTIRPPFFSSSPYEQENELYPDPFWYHLYLPLSINFRKFSKYIGRIQGGSMQSYLAYLLIVLLIMMLVFK